MAALLQTWVNKLTDSKHFSDEELFLYLSMIAGTFFAGAMHMILFGVMMIYQLWFLVVVNAVSVCLYVFVMILLFKRQAFKTVGLIVSGEVLIYTLVASLYTRTGDYVIMYYFVLVFMQFTVPYGSYKLRGSVLVLVGIALAVSLLAREYSTFIHMIAVRETNIWMSVFNVMLALGGVIAVLVSSNVVRDIIVRLNNQRMEEYKSQANTDALTGLRNRRYAETFFAGLSEKHGEDGWCVAMLDIDDFKVINDTMGHPVGDEVLCGLANILRDNLRKADVIFRWGGEEFLVLLADTELASAKKLMEKIRERIAGTDIVYSGGQMKMTVTIGVSRLDMRDIWASIAECDKKLYVGKRSGKNMVV